MAAGSGKPSTGIEQGEGLGQAVGAKSLTHAFLAGKKWVTAIHTARYCSIGFQLLTQPTVDEDRARMASLGHVGQQPNLRLDRAVWRDYIAPAQASHFANSEPGPVRKRSGVGIIGCLLQG